MFERQEKNYRLFCYFNQRRLANGRTIISIKTLEQYCKVPNYTIQHLINLRRLISEKHVDDVIKVLKLEFGYNPDVLSNKEQSEMINYELFN
jgi:RNA polymerase-interacting CarD/CdnL/TRCF family regulator